MKNEKESENAIHTSSSSTSVVVKSVDLTKLAGPSSQNDDAARRTAASIFERVLDEVFSKPTTSRPDPLSRQTISQPNLREVRAEFQVMRSVGGLINSTNLMHNENYVKNTASKKSLKRIPPSYASVLRLGPPITRFDSMTYPSIPFITRQPPPSYAEVHGGWDEETSIMSVDSMMLGPSPVYMLCPRCRTVVVSDIRTERSFISYVMSLALCVCMCWPCCLLPFCLQSCRNTYHFCPSCHYYLGVYRPC